MKLELKVCKINITVYLNEVDVKWRNKPAHILCKQFRVRYVPNVYSSTYQKKIYKYIYLQQRLDNLN